MSSLAHRKGGDGKNSTLTSCYGDSDPLRNRHSWAARDFVAGDGQALVIYAAPGGHDERWVGQVRRLVSPFYERQHMGLGRQAVCVGVCGSEEIGGLMTSMQRSASMLTRSTRTRTPKSRPIENLKREEEDLNVPTAPRETSSSPTKRKTPDKPTPATKRARSSPTTATTSPADTKPLKAKSATPSKPKFAAYLQTPVSFLSSSMSDRHSSDTSLHHSTLITQDRPPRIASLW